MFQKNLGALKNKNPKLAEQLSEIVLESINTIDVAQAENQDYILAYNGVPLHDIKDPTREAKSLWFRSVKNELKMNDIQVVFGLGLGYLFKRAYVSAPSKIFLFEPSLDILRFVFEYVDFSAEIADERVYFSNDEDDLLDKFESMFLVGDNVEFLFLPPYAQLFGEKLIAVTDNILNAIKNKGVDMNVLAFNSERSVQNILAHMTIYPQIRPVDYFKGKFEGKTALVLSAGPSMKDDLEKIKENKDKICHFCHSSCFKVLNSKRC
jgi:hypothetical protein